MSTEVKPTINTVSHSLSIASPNTPQPAGQKLVKVKILYPEDYTGPRFFSDGDEKEVSEETAAAFIQMGIASAVTDGTEVLAEENPASDNEPASDKKEVTDQKVTGDEKEVSEETADKKGKGKAGK